VESAKRIEDGHKRALGFFRPNPAPAGCLKTARHQALFPFASLFFHGGASGKSMAAVMGLKATEVIGEVGKSNESSATTNYQNNRTTSSSER
jgi:hypothetical protein